MAVMKIELFFYFGGNNSVQKETQLLAETNKSQCVGGTPSFTSKNMYKKSAHYYTHI